MELTANVWPEAAAFVFGLILCVSLRVKYLDATEANIFFRQLAYAVTAADFISVTSTVVRAFGYRVPAVLFLIDSTLFYMLTVLSAYCLLRYVVMRSERQNGRFFRIQTYVLWADFVLLLGNLAFGYSFSSNPDGSVTYGILHLPTTYGVGLWFLLTACVAQGIHKEKYTLLQRIVIRFAGVAMLCAFIIQFFFLRDLMFSYAVGIFAVYLIFFAVEVPVYRRVEETSRHLEEAQKNAQEAADKALAASRAKSNFLANTSHEIRTPMNAIMGMNEMILQGTQDAHIKEASLKVRDAGSALLQIISDVLDYARIESGRMTLVQGTYFLSDILTEIAGTWEAQITGKGLAFVIDIDDNVPDDLFGDQDKLRQILTNLVSNAYKYTEYGTIRLHARRETAGFHDMLILSVEDTGAGIRESELESIFSLFTRASIEEHRNIQGAGLGLKITDELSRMMGGSVRAESVYGKGSKFILRIPLHSKEEGKSAKETLRSKRDKARQKEEKPSFDAAGKRILVVDDTVVNLTVVRGLLRDTNARVDCALSGAEALKMAKDAHYDLVFLDHRMPEMDGIETLHALREMKGYTKEETKIIALTSNADESSRDFYLGKGFDDYLAKPMKSEELLRMVRTHLENIA